MGNVTAGGINDGDDDENEFYEVFIRKFKAIFGQFLLKVCLGRMAYSMRQHGDRVIC